MHDPLYERIYRLLADRQKRAVETVDQFALGTTVGSVRSRNEDVSIIANVRYAQSVKKDYTLALVCDGMGGMADGQQAALIAASTFVFQMLVADGPPSERLKRALAAAQHDVFEELRGDGGTTLSAIFIDNAGRAWLAHVGDSRVYAITLDGALRQLSRDDTIGAALNREKEKRADFSRLIQFVGAEGDIDPQQLSINSIDYSGFLLTSDGAHSAPPEVLSAVARHSSGGPELVRKLLSLAHVLGGLDNATAVHVPSNPHSAPSARAHGGDGDDSVLVTILCASGEHDIWITHLDAHRPMRRQKEVLTVDERGSYSRERQASPAKIKGARKRRAPKAKPETALSDDLLPEEKPKAKLDFSDDEEPKS